MMLSRSRAALVVAAAAFAGSLGLTASQSAPPAASADRPGASAVDRTLLDRYCVTCHNGRLKTAGLALDTLDLSQAPSHAAVLEKVINKLRSGQMPPPGRPRPDAASVDAFVTGLERTLDAGEAINPGRVVAHRLNRLEYLNAVHDLLDLDIDPSIVPPDSPGVGFDNNADALSVTPSLMNRYMSAASKVSRLAIGDPGITPAVQVYRASEFAPQVARAGEDAPFGTHGGLIVRHVFPLDGEYSFKLRMQRNTIGDTIRGIDSAHEIQVRIDYGLVRRFTIGGKYKGYDPGLVNGAPEDDIEGQQLHTYRLTADDVLEFRLAVKAGTRLVAATFSDSAPALSEQVPLMPSSPKRSFFTDDASDPGIDRITITGPFGASVPQETPSRRRIFTCQPRRSSPEGRASDEGCAREILTTLARRAYRRPVTSADVDELLELYRSGSKEGGFEAGIGLALETILWSPAFVMRLEHDPAGAAATYRISDLELASRLSFFLWRSIPDDRLLTLAARGRLHDRPVLEAEVHRMLNDPKARRWMADFSGQWLTVRNIDRQEPDPDIFPEFDDTLREAIATETRLFFRSQVTEDRSVIDLLSADYTFMNERLAQLYGVRGVYGSYFRKVPVTDPRRRGLLGQASVLAVTSYAHRTSVVLRGKWVLENLLGAPPPPPPANVPPLKENERGAPPKSLRERMEQHRANPVCASCHASMDPLGFALENFDAIGRWRDADSGLAIDAVSTMPGGAKIDGAAGFHDYLLSRSDQFVRTLTKKLLEYAVGRTLEYYDEPAARRIIRDAARSNYQWSSLVLGIVESAPFQMRRVAGERGDRGASGDRGVRPLDVAP
jgi:mono/diheme cytochrome c family protein